MSDTVELDQKYSPDDTEETWEEAKESFMNMLKEQQLSADEKMVESQMEKIKEAVWQDIPVEQVMDVALEIVVPEKTSVRVQFWIDVIMLYFHLPVSTWGCCLLERASRNEGYDLPVFESRAAEEIDRNEFIYNLSSQVQLALFFNFGFGEDLHENLSDYEVKQVMENTDVMVLFGYRDFRDNRLEMARKWLIKARERLDEPDWHIEELLMVMKMNGGPSKMEIRPSNNVQAPARQEAPRISRNAPCPCGSGLKYKHCCGKNA